MASWKDVTEEQKKDMWDAVMDKFEGDELLYYKDDFLGHMRELWNKWRGWMHFTYVKDKTPEEAMRTMPDGADKDDWEWLIKNHFYTEKFKGGKDGNPPNIGTIFYETRKQIDKLIEPETIAKYDEICEVMQSNPSLSNVEVVLKCFRNQSHGHVVGYGDGVKLKHLKGPSTKKT